MSASDDPLSNLVDSHCHLDMIPHWRCSEPPDSGTVERDQTEIMERAQAAGIAQLIVPGCAWQDFARMKDVARRFSQVWLAFGIHPHDASTWIDEPETRLLAELAHDRAVAVGECGLDYHYDLSPRDRQQAAFAAQIRLARAVAKPLIVHTRQADEDTGAILEAEGAAQVGGVLHCFTGSLDLAQRALELGFYISFSGVLTFAGSAELREVARQVPLGRTLIETDAPYLAPVPHRGKRNEPAHVVQVVRTLADLHGLAPETVGRLTAANAKRLFKLP